MIARVVLLTTLLAAVAIAVDQPLLGADRCTWGPAYWCESVENVKKCGPSAEAHCRAKVWIGDHPLAGITTPIAEDDNSVDTTVTGGECELCEYIGKQIFDKLKNNSTEEEILEEMEALCGYTPAPDTCKKYVDEYGRTFIELFADSVDVHQVCQVLGMCSEEFKSILKDAMLLSSLLSRNVGDIGCDTCTSLMGLVQKEVLSNEKQIEAMLDQVCPMLPVDQNECDSFLNGAFETAVSLFESYKAEELCEMVGLCGQEDGLVGMGVGPVDISGSTSLLGKDGDCENGPAFWCASEANAKLCNMVDFCKTADETTTVF